MSLALCALHAHGQAVSIDDAVSREVAIRVDGAATADTASLVDDAVSRECLIFVNSNDANGNGISDLVESTVEIAALAAASVTAPNSAWRDAADAAGDPGCGQVCPCSAKSGSNAANGGHGMPSDAVFLVAQFGGFTLPPNRVVSSVTADVMCRFDDGTSGVVDLRVAVGNQELLLSSQTFTSGTDCAYRFGGAGRLVAPPPGGWTQTALDALSVGIRRSGENESALRVTAFRLTITTVERDNDGDGVADTSDNCPNTPNPLQQDCDANGIGDACELALYPERDANQNGVVDACENVAGWIGGASGAFNDPSNWSSGKVPDSNTSLFLRGESSAGFNIATSSPVTVNSLVVASGVVRLTLGANLRVNQLFTVSSGATLTMESQSTQRTVELAGFSQVRGGGRLEILPTVVVRALPGGTFAAEPLSNIGIVLRPNNEVPLQTLGTSTLRGGIAVKLGVFAGVDLEVGTRFTIISAANLQTGFFSTLSAQGALTKFLKVIEINPFGERLLVLEVNDLEQFVRDAGGENQSVALGEEPTALVARNFTQPFDGFDDIAVTVRRIDGGGAQIPGNLYIFRGNGAGGISEQAVYGTGLEPIAVESADFDDDGLADLAVLSRASGELEIFLNATAEVSGFVPGDRKSVGVGGTFFAVVRDTGTSVNDSLVSSFSVLISNPIALGLVPARVVGGVIIPLPTIPVPTTPGPVSPIDDSGREESAFLVTRSAPAGNEYGFVSKVTVTPSGGLSFESTVLGPAQPLQVESGMLNSDSFADMIVAGLSSPQFGAVPSVNVFPGTSVGFATGGAIPLPKRPLGLAIGDFNGDGRKDFLVAIGTFDGVLEVGEVVSRFNNVTSGSANPVFESGPDDLLFAGQGVRRLRRANLNAVPPDDCAVLGEALPNEGGGSFFAGGQLLGYGGGRVFELTDQPPCLGDLNGDGAVGGLDVGLLFSQWGGAGTADFDGSGVVDAEDLTVVLVNWGACNAAD